MKHIKTLLILTLMTGVSLLFFVSGCETREWNNPFEDNCPKGIFTPTAFSAKQEGVQIVLSWDQQNTKISNFRILRKVEGFSDSQGEYTVDACSNTSYSYTDNIPVWGEKYEYTLCAVAGNNMSNTITTSITPVGDADIKTVEITEISDVSAVSGGTISDDGGSSITAFGVVWNTKTGPTLKDNIGFTSDGKGTGDFVSNLTGLTANTKYYLRAYATNSVGTEYGNEISFNTAEGGYSLYDYELSDDGLTLINWKGVQTEIDMNKDDALNKMTKIEGAFYENKSIEKVITGDSLKTIGENSFRGSSLKSITLKEGLETIYYGFLECSKLETIILPASVTNSWHENNIYFYGCPALTAINVADASTTYASVDGVLYNKNKTMLRAYPGGKTEISYTVPDYVKYIGDFAFAFDTHLKEVILEEGIEKIGMRSFDNANIGNYVLPSSVTMIGDSAFSNNSNLKTFTCNNPTPPTLGENVFKDLAVPTALVKNVSEGSSVSTATLYIPAGSKEKYESTDGWKFFGTIEEIYNPVLLVSAKSLDFGDSNTSKTFTISNTGSGLLKWKSSVSDDTSSWLSLSPTSGDNDGTVTVKVDRDNLKAGAYTGTITITSEGGNTDVIVNMTKKSSPVLSVSETLLDFGDSSTSETFKISNTGEGLLNWNASVSDDASWLSVSLTSGDNEGTVTVKVNRDSLIAGAYSGTIAITSDGGTKNVIVKMNVKEPSPILSVSIASMDFGDSNTSKTFTISNTGGGSLKWNASVSDDASSWISVFPTSGDNDSIVTVKVNRDSLRAGAYSGTITITSDGGNKNVSVNMIYTPSPILSVSTASMDFGDSNTSKTFTISNTGGGLLKWNASVSDDASWLSLSPTSGDNDGTVTVRIDRDDMKAGDYTGTITITSDGGTKNVIVKMNVKEPSPVLSVSATSLDFGDSNTSKTFTISNTGGGLLKWKASDSSSWLSLSPTSGDNDGAVTVRIDRDDMKAGDYAGIITITSDGGTKNVKVEMEVEPDLSVSTTYMNFGDSDTRETFKISNTGGGLLKWKASDSSSWLSLSPTSGDNDGAVTVRIDRDDMKAGDYNGTITITSDGGTKNVKVKMEVEPDLSVSTTYMNFGGSDTSETFKISNTGEGLLNWDASVSNNDSSWLSLSPTSGDNDKTVTVRIDRDGQNVGNYTGTITITSDGGDKEIIVKMEVEEKTVNDYSSADAWVVSEGVDMDNPLGGEWSYPGWYRKSGLSHIAGRQKDDFIEQRTYINFDFLNDIPSTATIESAQLRFYAKKGENRDCQFLISLPTESWGENTLTWNNQPACHVFSTKYSGPSSESLDYVYIDVTDLIKDRISKFHSNYYHGFRICVDFTGYEHKIDLANSGDERPYLEVNYH